MRLSVILILLVLIAICTAKSSKSKTQKVVKSKTTKANDDKKHQKAHKDEKQHKDSDKHKDSKKHKDTDKKHDTKDLKKDKKPQKTSDKVSNKTNAVEKKENSTKGKSQVHLFSSKVKIQLGSRFDQRQEVSLCYDRYLIFSQNKFMAFCLTNFELFLIRMQTRTLFHLPLQLIVSAIEVNRLDKGE